MTSASPSHKTLLRIFNAEMKGHSFCGWSKGFSPKSRHSVWVKTLDSNGWFCVHADGSRKDWVSALLKEAGVQ